MKTKFTLLLVTIITSTAFNWQKANAQANTTLSNLSSPTAINQSLLPNANNILNLGTTTKSWRILYLDSSIYLKDSLFMHSRGTHNTFVGQRAGYSITTGSNNTASGYHALYSTKTGYNNSAFGSLALSNTTTGFANSAFGYNALSLNTTGVANTAVGSSALSRNTTGKSNSALGHQALSSNTTGFENTASGYYALYSNTSGGENTAHGVQALYANTTGYENTASGYDALYSNTTGIDNTANGFGALLSNTTGKYNAATGAYALFSNKTGEFNTANGSYALYANDGGDNNTATGYQALNANTNGSGNTANGYKALYANQGNANTANGSGAMNSNTTGSENTANGYFALSSNTTGNYNTSIGNLALSYNTTGDANTAIGYETLFYNTTGYQNTGLGTFAGVVNPQEIYYNTTVLGYNATVDASNKVRIGNTNITSIGGQVGWTNFSDGRYKRNIKQDVQGLPFINSLQPITYTVDIEGLDAYYNKGKKRDSSFEKRKATMKESADKAAAIVYNGFIAQDVEKAAAKLNYNFSGVDKPQTKDGLYGLRYADFVVPLVKAVQELDKKTTELDKKTQEIDELRNEVKVLKELVQQLASAKGTTNSNSYVNQNIPNPSMGNTIIPFQIASGSRTAAIQILETGSGKVVKTIPVAVNATQVTVNTALLAAGAYSYSLLVDSRQVGTKQMVLTK